MDGADLASFSRQSERLCCDLEKMRCLAEVQPRFDPVVGGFEHPDAVMRSQRSNAFACPAIAMACDEAVAVQDAGDEIIIGHQCQVAHGGYDIGRGAVALSASPPGQAYLAVHTANPVNHETDLCGLRIDVGDDLLDQGGDAAEVLEPTESILDAVSLLIGFPVEAERLLAVRLVGDDGPGAATLQPSPQRRAVIGLVAEKLPGRFGATDEARGGWTIVRLAAAQENGKKTAFSICDCVDLRIAPAA
jgi:hypothetical protein